MEIKGINGVIEYDQQKLNIWTQQLYENREEIYKASNHTSINNQIKDSRLESAVILDSITALDKGGIETSKEAFIEFQQ